jgi:hypothetical protein
MAKRKKWTREEITRIFEILIERNSRITSHPRFRELLDRDQNLYANQVTREANGNIAYRSVDYDLEELGDEAFWDLLNATPHQDLIEENAAVALIKMAEKFDLIH